MRIPRLSILDVMVLLAILALVGSVPIRIQSRDREDFKRYLVNRANASARQLSAIADDPAGWIEEFRPNLRRQAEADREAGRQAEEAGEPPLPRTVGEAEVRSWARFRSAARQNGFRIPEPAMAPIRVRTLGNDLDMAWPALLAILLLAAVRPVREFARGFLKRERWGRNVDWRGRIIDGPEFGRAKATGEGG